MDRLRYAGALFPILVACEAPPRVDLRGPRVVASNLVGPRTVEVGVLPALEVQLTEPLDPETVSPRTVALVPWEEVGRCDLDPVCAEGSCERGRCMIDAVRDSDLSALERGDFDPTRGEPIELDLLDSPSGPDSLLRIVPARALLTRARHALILGAGLRDRSGAPLRDDAGEVLAWRRDFVTSGPGSSGPEAVLVRPAHREGGVPTNSRAIETAFPRPVVADVDAVLVLEAMGGDPVRLGDPRPCPGWVPGFCLSWTPLDPLAPRTSYAPADGTVEDVWGRRAVVPRGRTVFGTADGPDTVPPDLRSLHVRAQGGCVIATLHASEPAIMAVEAGGVTASVHGGGTLEAAVAPEPGSVAVGEAVAVNVRVEDLAGNVATDTVTVAADASFAADLPRLQITELLANPLGDEPDQELVEVANLGGDAVLGGLYLTDLTWADVLAAVGGGDPPGDALPAVELPVGAIAVVVGDDYVASDLDDPAPAPGSVLVRLDSSLADGGLKNAGEPLSLYRADPPALISSYGNFVDTGKQAHAGISVTRTTPTACDVAVAWRSHPLGTSSPGSLP